MKLLLMFLWIPRLDKITKWQTGMCTVFLRIEGDLVQRWVVRKKAGTENRAILHYKAIWAQKKTVLQQTGSLHRQNPEKSGEPRMDVPRARDFSSLYLQLHPVRSPSLAQPSAVKVGSPNHWAARNSLSNTVSTSRFGPVSGL